MENPSTPLKTVLVCEDDPDILRFIVETIRQGGFEAVGTGEAQAFLDAFAHVNPALVVLDVRLPGKDGFAIAEELRTRGSKVPVIFLTAYDRQSYRMYATIVVGGEFLVKPIEPAKLLSTIERMLKSPERLTSGEYTSVESMQQRIEKQPD